MATEQVVEQGSVSKTGTIVIPSLKTRTAKEWFEFTFDDRIYGKSTTVGVERWFSISGFILSSKRLSMTNENLKTKPLLIAILMCSIFVAVNEKQTINKNQFINN